MGLHASEDHQSRTDRMVWDHDRHTQNVIKSQDMFPKQNLRQWDEAVNQFKFQLFGFLTTPTQD